MTGVLEAEFREHLKWRGDNYSISTTESFADFVWDAGMHLEEIKTLDSVVIVDSRERSRRYVVQRVRGELRYWLATERDPMLMSRTGEGELGTVTSLEDAVTLCSEFLDGEVRISDLKTLRFAGGQLRGQRRVALLRHAEAYRFAYGLADLDRRQFVLLGLFNLRRHLLKREDPAADFDLLFFAKALDEMFESKQAMKSILDGEDLRWWPEDDDAV